MFNIFKRPRRYLLTKHGKRSSTIWATSMEVVNGSLVAKIGNRTTAVFGPGTFDGAYDLSCKDNKWYEALVPEERPAPPPAPPEPPAKRHPAKPHYGANRLTLGERDTP
jgi:hypothetical protein